MVQHAQKFAFTPDAHVPMSVTRQRRFGFAPDDVLLLTTAGCNVSLRNVDTDAGHLLDGHGGTSVSMIDVYTNRRPLHYGISNFSATMESLFLRWTSMHTFEQGPNEAWMRFHHVGTMVCEQLRLNGFMINGHDGPKEGVQLRSGEHFEFNKCFINSPISIGPNLVDGVIDPHAEPVQNVHFAECVLRDWPRLVAPQKYVQEVVFDNCTVKGQHVKFRRVTGGKVSA